MIICTDYYRVRDMSPLHYIIIRPNPFLLFRVREPALFEGLAMPKMNVITACWEAGHSFVAKTTTVS